MPTVLADHAPIELLFELRGALATLVGIALVCVLVALAVGPSTRRLVAVVLAAIAGLFSAATGVVWAYCGGSPRLVLATVIFASPVIIAAARGRARRSVLLGLFAGSVAICVGLFGFAATSGCWRGESNLANESTSAVATYFLVLGAPLLVVWVAAAIYLVAGNRDGASGFSSR